jgi:hypothetical protein
MFELKTLTDYSDESLLREMRRVVAEFKGKKLTLEEFDRVSRVHSTTLRHRFGSWPNALDKAGISAEIAPRPKQITRKALLEAIQAHAQKSGEPPKLADIAEQLDITRSTIPRKFGKWPDLLKEVGLQPVPLGKRYTDEECFENIVELWTHYGRQPNFRELNSAPSRVGSKAYVRRWGGWRPALGAFINYINQSSLIPRREADATTEPSQSPLDSSKAPSSEPRSLSLALRYKVLCRDRFRCQICGRSPAKDIGVELHVDHLIPWSKGGQNTEENLRVLCFDCNLGKGAKHEVI